MKFRKITYFAKVKTNGGEIDQVQNLLNVEVEEVFRKGNTISFFIEVNRKFIVGTTVKTITIGIEDIIRFTDNNGKKMETDGRGFKYIVDQEDKRELFFVEDEDIEAINNVIGIGGNEIKALEWGDDETDTK